MKKLVIILLILPQLVFAQFDRFSGSYPVFNYSNDEFNSPVQIWTGCQTKFGEFIFGNDERLLRFNSRDWSFIETQFDRDTVNPIGLAGKKNYKLFVSSDKTIYATRNGSIGRIAYNSRGIPMYFPILESMEIKGGWGIHELPNGQLFFLNHNGGFVYNPASNEMKPIAVPSLMEAATNLNSIKLPHGILISTTHLFNDSLAKVNGQGSLHLFSFEDYTVREVKGFQGGRESYNIRGHFEVDGQHYLVDQKKGIIGVDLAKDKLSKHQEKNPFSSIDFPINAFLEMEDYLFFGTEKNGLVIYAKNGQLIRSFNTSDGILDDHVYAVFEDNIGNIWLALDNGISVIEFSSDVMSWARTDGLGGALEDVSFYENNLIIAARSGLFYSSKKNTKLAFQRSDDIDESAFGLLPLDSVFDHKILVISFNGIYSFDPKSLRTSWIAYEVYAWKLMINPFKTNSVLVGGEGFFGELVYHNGEWEFSIIQSLDTEVRFFLEHEGRVLFSNQGNGVFEYQSTGKIVQLEFDHKFSLENTHFVLCKLRGKVFAGTTKGLYVLNDNRFQAVESEGIQLHSGFASVHRLFSDNQDRLWAVIHEGKNQETNNIGYFLLSDKGVLHWNKVNNALLNRGVINAINQKDDLIFFGSSKGLYALNPTSNKLNNENWDVFVSTILVDDSLVMGIPGLGDVFPKLNHNQRIRFNLFSGIFSNGGQTEYRTRLIGFNNEWSAFESPDFKVFEKLPHGSYIFEVQGRNMNNQQSKIYQFAFTVLPPWYLTWWAYSLYLITVLIIVFVSSALSIQRVKRQNKRLEILVNERTQEISEKNSILEQQRDEIHAKTEDILDSIKYAKRLQDTILPPTEFLDRVFDEHFVFYRPKDIVSGDFYWAREVENKLIWAAADCTGHGVPGAMVSLVGNNGLLRATNEFNLSQPAEILNRLRRLVLESFKAQGANDVKDGMDIALAVWDKSTNILQFAGANNNLLVIRNNEIIEYKGDKQPIGDYAYKKDFMQHEFQLNSGDLLYMYTDGYVDQFGGETPDIRSNGGKKFKSKAFKLFLQSIAHEPMDEQLLLLTKRFDDWRGELEQIDDVCVFGVKVN
jgi:serine phosphatase RsbU (regulator of sigma subunit)